MKLPGLDQHAFSGSGFAGFGLEGFGGLEVGG